ncbi:MAG TPA: Coenzyme F420 hydrogenase/dehydrogenase, beta subunit C-terminal domain [bacterium]|nr:Coenzyme F420 hydrogenase/dehydrogenase, beta subunit C-terminal domain [bacterium]
MELKLKKGPQDLEARVLKQGLCCSCGACMGLCPYFLVMKEHVVLMEPCGLLEGRCYDVCPRTVVDMEALNMAVHGRGRDDFALGTSQGVFMSQSADAAVRERGQYGGTVTALLAHGLESGMLDGALMAGSSARYGLLPEPVLAKTVDEVIAAAGSKYTACPTLGILDRSLRECGRLAVVGRPCQVTALRKRIACDPEIGQRIALVVGLFCMWSLDYQKLAAHLADKLELGRAQKIDIPYNRFVVVTEDGPQDLPFEPIRALRKETCDLCFDFTSEFADLSVGSTEWKPDWNTLIVRTGQGRRAVDAARDAGRLSVQPLPHDRIELLRQASRGKKKRALAAIADPGCKVSDYLVLAEAERKELT